MTLSIGPEELEIERDVLRLLCSNVLAVDKRAELCRVMDDKVFHDPMHRALFDEIRFAGPIDGSYLREILPGRMTNRGFPDFDLCHFHFSGTDTEEAVHALFSSANRLMAARGTELPLR